MLTCNKDYWSFELDVNNLPFSFSTPRMFLTLTLSSFHQVSLSWRQTTNAPNYIKWKLATKMAEKNPSGSWSDIKFSFYSKKKAECNLPGESHSQSFVT